MEFLVHLLTAQVGTPDTLTDPIDLDQTPGDIVVLTSADTEIAGLARAWNNIDPNRNLNPPSLRLANLLQLSHNFSVDLYIEKTLSAARLIIIRVLGGPSYWQYGLDEVRRLARGHGIQLAVVSGSAYRDETLDAYSTISQANSNRLWAYLVEGGPENYRNFLLFAHHLIDPKIKAPTPAKPLAKAGLYWPGEGQITLDQLNNKWQNPTAPVTAITFYRALLQAGDLAPIDALIESLQKKGLNPMPAFASSLKDEIAIEILSRYYNENPPSVTINTTSFAVAKPGMEGAGTVLDQGGAPVLQAILAGTNQNHWQENTRGLIARDIAMNVALPEIDGRVTTRAISFKADLGRNDAVEANLTGHQPLASRIEYVTDLAANWATLQQTPMAEKRIALILSNYPATDGRIANGVGLDTPAGSLNLMKALQEVGLKISNLPGTPNSLIEKLQNPEQNKPHWARFSLHDYQAAVSHMPADFTCSITDRWGKPDEDPSFETESNSFLIRALDHGHLTLALQPGRGEGLDAKQSHHDATIPPTHGYLAFYLYLRKTFKAHIMVHMGKHGNLEWMPGKALALSQSCAPEVIFGPMPHLYPFIVNDPGEGAQAKRRTSAVIIDHLTPPLTRAESYGPLKDLEALVDEYYEAAGVDPRRTGLLGNQIIDLAHKIGLNTDCNIRETDSPDEQLQKLDNYLCELKELQIRDGLHVFGQSPEGPQKTNMLTALTRLPRGNGKGKNQSLLRALSHDLALGFDPLTATLGKAYTGPRPQALNMQSSAQWRTIGDTIERLETLMANLIDGNIEPSPEWPETSAVLTFIKTELAPKLETCGNAEISAVISGLKGRFIAPGPSGAPTRGRLDTLPTGRNFYTIDTRTLPTETAWALGAKSAERIITAYTQEHGTWPKQIAMSAWGTANMRTGGDDLAQAMAFIGARPTWDSASRRITGFEIIPLSELKRPRVDLIFRISGFFRDAFPGQIELLQSAINAVASLDEDEDANPLAAAVKKTRHDTMASQAQYQPALNSTARIFGPAETAYGAGLKTKIHDDYQSGTWQDRAALAETYINASANIYGREGELVANGDNKQALAHFKALLKTTNLVIHNQDNREFDLLDSEDFYQFEGGLGAAVEAASGTMPEIYHNDHSNPENPKVQTLGEEIARIVRARAANPKWIKAIMKHGHRGAGEMLATVSNLTAFARLTNSIKPHQFESLYEAYLVDETVKDFLKTNNLPALREMAAIFKGAIDHGLWQPKRNSTHDYLRELEQDILTPE